MALRPAAAPDPELLALPVDVEQHLRGEGVRFIWPKRCKLAHAYLCIKHIKG
jgi:hypothetical protein